MKSIAQKKRYLQHEVTTKLYAVRLYRQARDVQYVCRRYHVSKASLMRWNRRYDGTRESLTPKSRRPKTPHPNAHTEEELSWIRNLHRRNPNISVCEMYGKLWRDQLCGVADDVSNAGRAVGIYIDAGGRACRRAL